MATASRSGSVIFHGSILSKAHLADNQGGAGPPEAQRVVERCFDCGAHGRKKRFDGDLRIGVAQS